MGICLRFLNRIILFYTALYPVPTEVQNGKRQHPVVCRALCGKEETSTHQGFSSYRDPPQFITGESLTAVVCDGWFPKMIPILQHVSVVELIFSPLGSGQSCDFFDQ